MLLIISLILGITIIILSAIIVGLLMYIKSSNKLAHNHKIHINSTFNNNYELENYDIELKPAILDNELVIQINQYYNKSIHKVGNFKYSNLTDAVNEFDSHSCELKYICCGKKELIPGRFYKLRTVLHREAEIIYLTKVAYHDETGAWIYYDDIFGMFECHIPCSDIISIDMVEPNDKIREACKTSNREFNDYKIEEWNY